MRMLPAVLGVVLLCTGLGTATLAKDKPKGTPLTGQDLKALIGSGALLDWENPSGVKGTTVLFKDGTARLLYLHTFLGQGDGDQGTWRIDGDSICFKWVAAARGEYCAQYYRVGDNQYETHTSALRTTLLASRFTVRK